MKNIERKSNLKTNRVQVIVLYEGSFNQRCRLQGLEIEVEVYWCFGDGSIKGAERALAWRPGAREAPSWWIGQLSEIKRMKEAISQYNFLFVLSAIATKCGAYWRYLSQL